ncbi:hypothetical protein [Bernardetia sp.]|uniref:hypothetical protein n=1 Tax=Bernardetia sp. TaxID=1937974 RepID=UPI0025B8066F|nr:hypothetical protein [Bernardetia sp.]
MNFENIEDVFEEAIAAFSQVFFNLIGACLRWLFFFGRVSFSRLKYQKIKNILVGIVFWVVLLAGGWYWIIHL